MAQDQLQLNDMLKTFAPNVYFQPPTGMAIKYPCIVYNIDADDVKYANNAKYSRLKRYQVTYISNDPRDPVPDRLANLPLCSFTRRFMTAELTHDVFNLFF